MFSDNALYVKTLDNFANAAGIIVGSELPKFENLGFRRLVPDNGLTPSPIGDFSCPDT